jgi:UrcA family protein
MQIRTTRNTVIAAVVFSVLSGFSTIGTANLPELTIDSVRVSYADLNLSKMEDAEALYARLRRTAENVCEDTRRKSLNEMIDERECKERALDRAVQEVAHVQVTEIHQD